MHKGKGKGPKPKEGRKQSKEEHAEKVGGGGESSCKLHFPENGCPGGLDGTRYNYKTRMEPSKTRDHPNILHAWRPTSSAVVIIGVKAREGRATKNEDGNLSPIVVDRGSAEEQQEEEKSSSRHSRKSSALLRHLDAAAAAFGRVGRGVRLQFCPLSPPSSSWLPLETRGCGLAVLCSAGESGHLIDGRIYR